MYVVPEFLTSYVNDVKVVYHFEIFITGKLAKDKRHTLERKCWFLLPNQIGFRSTIIQFQ